MSFATADDFAARIGEILTDAEETRADALLATATGLIQDEAQQTILLVEDDELTMPGTTDDRIRLPQRPVVSVTSVTLGATELGEGSDWYLDGNEIVRIAAFFTPGAGILDGPFLLGSGSGFGRANQTLTIVYTHGYDDDAIPASLKAICMEMVVRVWVNPGSVARESIGDTSTVYDNNRFSPAGLLLSSDEQRVIRRMFGRKARSVTVGGGP